MSIQMVHLAKIYGNSVQALQSIDLTIENGIFGLLGPNGAGKTTLMRIIAGIVQPTGGHYLFNGEDGCSPQGRRVLHGILGYLPQELGIYPDLSAYEFLDYVGLLKGLDDARQRRQRIDELLSLVDLTTVARRKLKTFSGGMKRRVGIAQALLNDPKLLIVDEPTAGLDPEERIRFRNILSELSGNRIVLLSTHIVEDIAQTCQNIAVIVQGRVVFNGTTSTLLEAARGHVWSIATTGQKPSGDLTIMATLHQEHRTLFRVVGTPPVQEGVTPVEPQLEDGYMWLMRTFHHDLKWRM